MILQPILSPLLNIMQLSHFKVRGKGEIQSQYTNYYYNIKNEIR